MFGVSELCIVFQYELTSRIPTDGTHIRHATQCKLPVFSAGTQKSRELQSAGGFVTVVRLQIGRDATNARGKEAAIWAN
jgi:hypothetical protein